MAPWSSSMYGLVDGNNFYVSCERVFRPALVGVPVIVLSNNDGCAVSRSNEAKALGVQMGQHWFQCRDLERTAGLVGLSSNYALYGDMSNRMMTIAAEYAPRQEIYSIDESFLEFDGVQGDLVTIGRGNAAARNGQPGAGGETVVNGSRAAHASLHDDLGRDAGGEGMNRLS